MRGGLSRDVCGPPNESEKSNALVLDRSSGFIRRARRSRLLCSTTGHGSTHVQPPAGRMRRIPPHQRTVRIGGALQHSVQDVHENGSLGCHTCISVWRCAYQRDDPRRSSSRAETEQGNCPGSAQSRSACQTLRGRTRRYDNLHAGAIGTARPE